mmetsp:Transcript_15058/g.42783  ORF Transcript_15058/g.42783 Transcript_15058/m.42783 type:complete len:241 (-) Transcript_15058:12-734(-)
MRCDVCMVKACFVKKAYGPNVDAQACESDPFSGGGLRHVSVNKDEPPQSSKKAEATHRYDEKGTSTEGWAKDRDASSSETTTQNTPRWTQRTLLALTAGSYPRDVHHASRSKILSIFAFCFFIFSLTCFFVRFTLSLTCFFFLLTVSLTRFFVLRMELVRLSIDEDRDIVPLGLAGGLSSTARSAACSAARWRRVATMLVCGAGAQRWRAEVPCSCLLKSMSVWRLQSVQTWSAGQQRGS